MSEGEKGVQIYGNVIIGEGVSICGPADINGNQSQVTIGKGCDIGAFTAINCADSHKRAIGLCQEIERKPIEIGERCFIGSHCLVKGGVILGDRCVVAGGTVVDAGYYPSRSLIYGSYPTKVKPGYYSDMTQLMAKGTRWVLGKKLFRG